MIKKHKSGCYKITLPIYLIGFYLAFDNESADKLSGNTYTVDQGMVQEYEDDPTMMIIINRTHEVIAHELTHVALILTQKIGIHPSYEDQEPIAYIMGYIAEQFYKCLDRHES